MSLIRLVPVIEPTIYRIKPKKPIARITPAVPSLYLVITSTKAIIKASMNSPMPSLQKSAIAITLETYIERNII